MKQKIYLTATIITALSIAERALGFLYKIALSRFIGAEGMGIYQVALSPFVFFLTLGTGGIPVTVSRMISKSKAERSVVGEYRAVSAGFTLSLLTALPICCFFLLFGKNLPFLFADARAFDAFKILLPGLPLASVYAVIRGYFWGNKELLSPALMEIAQESVMVAAGFFLFLYFGTPASAAQGAERAAQAVSFSYLFSFCVAVLCFFRKNGKLVTPKKNLKPLFNATLPVTSVRASNALLNSLIAVLLPAALLKTGLSETEALKAFGVVTGMAMPVLFIPTTVIGSISLVLVPELSEDFYKRNEKRLTENLRRGLRIGLLIACWLFPFFFALGKDIGRIAFSNALAGEIIERSCLILFPMSLTVISTPMLNSMGFERKTFLHFLLGAAAMLLCVLFLPSICGIYAYMCGLGANFAVNALCNLLCLRKNTPIFSKRDRRTRTQTLCLTLFVTLLLSVVGKFSYSLFKTFFGELFSVVLCALVLSGLTVGCYLLLNIISPKDSKFDAVFKKNAKKQPNR